LRSWRERIAERIWPRVIAGVYGRWLRSVGNAVRDRLLSATFLLSLVFENE
jgi:hypothetical protein